MEPVKVMRADLLRPLRCIPTGSIEPSSRAKIFAEAIAHEVPITYDGRG
jgi:hypothetical protein